jgi:hypothetical protein
MTVYKPWFLRNEPTVFRLRFERIHHPAKRLELGSEKFFGGFVFQNEPTGTPQFDPFRVLFGRFLGSFPVNEATGVNL